MQCTQYLERFETDNNIGDGQVRAQTWSEMYRTFYTSSALRHTVELPHNNRLIGSVGGIAKDLGSSQQTLTSDPDQ
jgi:hypothetical protein